jgi:hypothetical protein
MDRRDESSRQRETHLRKLQSRPAQGPGVRDLQQQEAQTASRLTL